MNHPRPSLSARHEVHDRPWAVRGTVHVHQHRDGAHVVYYAEDEDGVIALSESRDELERALEEQGHRPQSAN